MLAVDAIDSAVRQLGVVVVASEGRVAPPLSRQTPGPGERHHAACELVAFAAGAHEIRLPAIADHLERCGWAECAQRYRRALRRLVVLRLDRSHCEALDGVG